MDIPSPRGRGAAGHWSCVVGMIMEIFIEHRAELSKKQLIRDLLIRCHQRLGETVKLRCTKHYLINSLAALEYTH